MLVNLNPLKKNVLLPRFMLEDLKEALTKKLRETLQQEPLLRWALVKQHEPLVQTTRASGSKYVFNIVQ